MMTKEGNERDRVRVRVRIRQEKKMNKINGRTSKDNSCVAAAG
jgi:hypothetical protein